MLSVFAFGQVMYTPQEVVVSDLPSLMTKSKDRSDVLAASVATILHDKEICCGTDSSLQDSVLSADPRSLKEVASKLQGRQHLPDGRPIMVTAEFWPVASANSGQIIGALRANHALLMQWNSHLYVVYGVIFNDTFYGSAESVEEIYVIQKFLLLDLRYSDSRRKAVFDRQTDSLDKVQGLLLLQWKPQ